MSVDMLKDVLEEAREEEAGETKQCVKCGKVKPLNDFSPDKRTPDGRAHTCRACRQAAWSKAGKTKKARKDAEAKRLTLDFTGHEHVLDWLERRAVCEIRTVDSQALYNLKTVMESYKNNSALDEMEERT